MKYDPTKHHRRSIRLRGYDYSDPGAYFITLNSRYRQPFFGRIVGEEMQLSRYGEVVLECWDNISHQFENVELDEFIVMPDHVHGIVVILDSVEDKNSSRRRGLINQSPITIEESTNQSWIMMKNPKIMLGKIVRAFKARTTKMIHDMGLTSFEWQRNYYERIIRGERELQRVRRYISNNIQRWALDERNAACRPKENGRRSWPH